MAGRPKGSRNEQTSFRDALRIELAAADHRALRKIAQGLIAKATQGNVAAIREVADRLDGKPAHAVEMGGGLAISHEAALRELA